LILAEQQKATHTWIKPEPKDEEASDDESE